MKKLVLSIIFGLFFISCSRDSDEIVNKNSENSKIIEKQEKNEEKIFVTKAVHTNPFTDDEILTYSYDGDKLKEVVKEIMNKENKQKKYFSTTTYQYDGDLIKSTSQVDVYGNTKEVEYTYNLDGQLTKSVSTIKYRSPVSQLTIETKDYTYKENGVIEVAYTLDEQPNVLIAQSRPKVYTYTLVDGLITKVIQKNIITGTEITKLLKYDTKNSPLMNIRGISALAIELFGAEQIVRGFGNNIAFISEKMDKSERGTKIEYEYTSHNYPAKITLQQGGFIETFVLTYNK